MMHYARSDKSDRLQRVLSLIRQGWISSFEIQDRAVVCSASTIISELRHNGHKIERRTRGKRPDMIHEYRLVN